MFLHLDWALCADHYRIEERQPSPRARRMIAIGSDEPYQVIVPNSRNFVRTSPLEIPFLYRQLMDCGRSQKGLLKFVNAHGFLFAPEAEEENVENAMGVFLDLHRFVALIDKRDWPNVSDALNKAHSRASGGVGRLGMILRPPESEKGRPMMLLRPATLVDGIYAQAIADAAYGPTEIRKCRNPECPRYFAVGGAGGLRRDAEYHSPDCQNRHAYLRRIGKG